MTPTERELEALARKIARCEARGRCVRELARLRRRYATRAKDVFHEQRRER